MSIDEPRYGGRIGIETIKTYVLVILFLSLIFSVSYAHDLKNIASQRKDCFDLLLKYANTSIINEIYNETNGFSHFPCERVMLDFVSEISQEYNVSFSEVWDLVICIYELK